MNNELYHHGILGQKWGVRRFQNQDRTWTAQGKERYGDGSTGSNNASQDHRNAHSGKKMEQMSTKQLKAHNQRLQAQAQYKKLTQKPGRLQTGLKMVAGIGAALGTYVAFKSNFKNVFGVDLQKAVSDGANAIANGFFDTGIGKAVGRQVAPLAAAVTLNANVNSGNIGASRPATVQRNDSHRYRYRYK